MNKHTIIVFVAGVLVALMLAPKLRQLPGVSKLPTF